MMGFTSLPISFWGYALETAYCILNKIPSKSVDKTPYEIWTGRKPVLSHLRVWRCPAYVKYLKTDKLGSKFDRCLFVGYPKKLKGTTSTSLQNKKCLSAVEQSFWKKSSLVKELMPVKLNLMKFMR